ncbi:MAG TPA: AraC family transcriptional regulator [Sphingobacteriaceae bacterium]
MDPASRKNILRARLFIEQNLQSRLSGDSISQQAFRSYYRFHHQFKAFTGESVWQYVKRLRLERSSFLLKYTTMPVAEIAFNIGFESTAAFSKAFSARNGQSPVKFRNDVLTRMAPIKTGGYKWNDTKRIWRPDEKICTFRSEGAGHFPAGYFKWQQLAAPVRGNTVPLIGKSPDQPGITGTEKFRWDTSVPKDAVPRQLQDQLVQKENMFEETLSGGAFLKVPFVGFGRPLTEHLPALLDHLRDQGLEWRPSGSFFQTIREHAEKNRCITDLFIPVSR